MAVDFEVLKVVLSAFGGAVVGAIAGFCSNVYLANRKEKYDARANARKRRSEYHLERRDHLAKLLARLAEARSIASNARSADRNKASNVPEYAERAKATYESYLSAFNEQSTKAMVEAELYGEIPHTVDIGNFALSSYVSVALDGRLYFVTDKDAHPMQVQDAYGHMRALEADIRALAAYEQVMSEAVLVDGKRD